MDQAAQPNYNQPKSVLCTTGHSEHIRQRWTKADDCVNCYTSLDMYACRGNTFSSLNGLTVEITYDGIQTKSGASNGWCEVQVEK